MSPRWEPPFSANSILRQWRLGTAHPLTFPLPPLEGRRGCRKGRFRRGCRTLGVRMRLGLEAAGGLAGGRHRGARTRRRLPLRILGGAAGVAHDLLAPDHPLDLVERLASRTPGGPWRVGAARSCARSGIWRAGNRRPGDAADLLIDQLRRRVRHVLALVTGSRGTPLPRSRCSAEPELVGEAELRDHPAREAGGAADVVGGAGGHLLGTEDDSSGGGRRTSRRAAPRARTSSANTCPAPAGTW